VNEAVLPTGEAARKQFRRSVWLVIFMERTMSALKVTDQTNQIGKNSDQIGKCTELGLDELGAVSGGNDKTILASTLSNIANMKHEQLKAIAQNLRG
jgi:hypothetical protein